MCEVPDRLLQRRLIIHVKPSRMPIDLSQQPPENLPRPDFHKRLHALPNQQPNGLLPFHRAGYLSDQRITPAVAVLDYRCIHITSNGHAGIPECNPIQVSS